MSQIPTPAKKSDEETQSPNTTLATVPSAKKKFHNGWTREIEIMLAEWADKAVCFRWMHEHTQRIFRRKDMGFMFPVIILSTVTGAANFALDSFISDVQQKKYAQVALGGLSIVTGIISTIANRLGYGSSSEAHRSAALSWGKFQRTIALQLALHPNERNDCMQFLKLCGADLDRMSEQSPTIPEDVIDACRKEFAKYPRVRKPEIVGDIDTTSVFKDTNSRLREIAKEAAITIAQKKGVLKQIVLDDLEPRIKRVLDANELPEFKAQIAKEAKAAAEKGAREAVAAAMAGRLPSAPVPSSKLPVVAQQAKERAAEIQNLAASNIVKNMRQQMAGTTAKLGDIPVGIGTIITPISLADKPGKGIAPTIVIHDGYDQESDESEGESISDDDGQVTLPGQKK